GWPPRPAGPPVRCPGVGRCVCYTKGMQPRLRSAVIVAVMVTVPGVACGGDGNSEQGGGSTATTAAPAPTTATTATVAANPTRVEQVLAQLLAVRNQIFSSPDPNRVAEYALAECPCAEEDRKSLQGLSVRFEHWDSPQLELRGARVAARPGTDEAVLEAVVGRPPERVVNRTGALIRGQGQGLPNFPVRFVLRRRDGNWRLAEVANTELPPATVDAIAAAGVPTGPPDDASRL
ncbi:MAG: hypothetical protein ACRD0C_21670, partial [Acidimicrobiia bacterium]